jgi:hypothetical protein
LLSYAILVRLQSKLFLASTLQAGFADLNQCLSRIELLLLAFYRAGADKVLSTQIAIALGIEFGELPPGSRILALRFGGADGTGGPSVSGFRRTKALIQVNRVDFGQQLPTLHHFTHIHMYGLYSPGGCWPDEITTSCFDSSDAKYRW